MKMRLLICAAILITVQGRSKDKGCEDVVVVNGKLFDREVLVSNLSIPYQLAIDYDTDLLFFSHGIENEMGVFKSAFINLKTNEYQQIEGISHGFAHTVDRKNHIVYMGGDDGIYTFDFDTKTAKFYGDRHSNVWQMFFKDKLYYTLLNEHAFFFDKGMSHEVPELKSTYAKSIGIDAEENIIFANSTGLFWYQRVNNTIAQVGDEKYLLTGITSDLNGKIVLSTLYGIYTIDTNGEIHNLATIEDVYGVAIDANGSIIYATKDSVVRLKHTDKTCTKTE